jgi:DnaJ-class molecular chaperone
MKQIVCEMCDGKELIKQDGVFVCQSCGTKYSVEEAKKMMVEVDTSAKMENALKKARRAMENKNYKPAQEYYEIILKEEPDNWESAFL